MKRQLLQPLQRGARWQPLKCFRDYLCRCHQRSVVRTIRQRSIYKGNTFLGFSSLSWTFKSLAQCNFQNCRLRRKTKASMEHFLLTWLRINLIRFSRTFSFQKSHTLITVETRNKIPHDSKNYLHILDIHIEKIKYLLYLRTVSLNNIDLFSLELLHINYHLATYSLNRIEAKIISCVLCFLREKLRS